MSAFEQELGRRLSLLSKAWAREFSEVMGEARTLLDEIERLGCDRHFVLVVLVNYRWRRLRAVRERPGRTRLLRGLDVVLADGPWQDRLKRAVGSEWPKVGAVVQRARENVMAKGRTEESAFEATWTVFEHEGAHWRSANTYKCLWILDWHLRQTRGSSGVRRQRLLELMADFGFLEQRSRATVAKRLEAKRNPIRALGMQNIQRAMLGFLIRKCHELHRVVGVPCGPVCTRFPHVLRGELPAGVARAHLEGIMAAMAGNHDVAIESFRRALKEAGEIAKGEEYQVSGLLWQYAASLDAVGRHREARVVRGRSARMDRRLAKQEFPL